MSNENGAAVAESKPRTKAVSAATFAVIYNRCNTLEEVIAAVEKETGIRMTKQNVADKASKLRKNTPHLKKLERRNARKTDYAALDALLVAQAESEKGQKEVTDTKEQAESEAKS